MEAKSILKEFRQRRKLLENLRENMATPRLKGMWNFLYRQTETQRIIFLKIPSVEHLIRKATPDTPVEAEAPEEIVGIGLYIMRQCSKTKKHITEIIHDLGIGRRDPKSTRQGYVDDAMFGYINPALDFIERELEELEKPKEKTTAPKKSRVKDVRLSDKTADELTIEEASIAAYSVPDQPTRHDTLGFEPYTTAIAEFLSHERTRPPLTLSVEGEWGTGKTSFMLQLKEKLERKNALTVEFSPWRHDKEDLVWAAFVLAFTEQLSEELGFFKSLNANLRLLLRRFNWREGWFELAKVIVKFLAYAFVLLGILVVLIFGWIPYFQGTGVRIFLGLFSIGGAIFTFIWKVLKPGSEVIGNPFKHDLKKYVQAPDYTSRIPFIEKFHRDFKKIVETYADDKRVYVFIDDLDRCEVPKAAELMQAINLMISDDPQLIFIIGLNREKVAAGLAVKHKELLTYISPQPIDVESRRGVNANRVNALRYGYSFIEKFIQLPFSVPRPTEAEINNLMDEMATIRQEEKELASVPKEPQESKRESEKHKTEQKRMLDLKIAEDSTEVRQIVLMVSPVFDYNPRRIKQFINLFRLRVYIAHETGLFDIPEGKTKYNRLTLEQLGKFVAITMGWPSLIADLSQNTDLLKKLVRTSEKDIQGESEYVQRWFKDERLMSLVEYVSDKKRDKGEDLEWTQYSLLYVDVKKLLEISPKVRSIVEPISEDQDEELRRKLNMRIEELGLSYRVMNCLASADVQTVGHLVRMTALDLLKIRGFGKACLREVMRMLADIGLSLGMTV